MTQPSIAGTRLTASAYAAHLDADLTALLEASTDLAAAVPGCPGWTVADLDSHVLGVYRHKSVALRTGTAPPPREGGDWGVVAEGADVRAELSAAYADLRSLLAADPGTATWAWWPGEQTGGFWQRRMAQETAVHRWDAESAVHGPDDAAPVAEDLALDGVDEILGWLRWPWDEVQADASGQRVLVSAGEVSWLVTLNATSVDVVAGSADSDADALLAGEPSGLLLHLWGRPGEHGIAELGDATALRLLRARLAEAAG